jgi:hypothetical protein
MKRNHMHALLTSYSGAACDTSYIFQMFFCTKYPVWEEGMVFEKAYTFYFGRLFAMFSPPLPPPPNYHNRILPYFSLRLSSLCVPCIFIYRLRTTNETTAKKFLASINKNILFHEMPPPPKNLFYRPPSGVKCLKELSD